MNLRKGKFGLNIRKHFLTVKKHKVVTPLGKLREDRGLSHVIAELDRAPDNKMRRNNPNCSPGMSEMTSQVFFPPLISPLSV